MDGGGSGAGGEVGVASQAETPSCLRAAAIFCLLEPGNCIPVEPGRIGGGRYLYWGLMSSQAERVHR